MIPFIFSIACTLTLYHINEYKQAQLMFVRIIYGLLSAAILACLEIEFRYITLSIAFILLEEGQWWEKGGLWGEKRTWREKILIAIAFVLVGSAILSVF